MICGYAICGVRYRFDWNVASVCGNVECGMCYVYVVYGMRSVVCGEWCVVCGVWYVVRCMWHVIYGSWCIACG